MNIKKVLLIILLFILTIPAQRIGLLAPEKPREQFPPNTMGVDLIFSDGGFGLGYFYKRDLSPNTSGFLNFSISELKDDREMEYVDPYYGFKIVYGKVNRALLIPLVFGINHRIFSETITDNLRPYIIAGVGPTMVVVSPYYKDDEILEYFTSLKYAKAQYTLGGQLGIGANFGLSKKNVLGLEMKYNMIYLFSKGIENIEGKYRKDLSSLFISITIGFMY